MPFWTAANAITIFRLALVPLVLYYIYVKQPVLATEIFVLAWALDAVDGFVARHFKQTTGSGSFLDKLTDRLLIVLTLFALIINHYLPPIAVLIITKDMMLILAIPAYKSRG